MYVYYKSSIIRKRRENNQQYINLCWNKGGIDLNTPNNKRKKESQNKIEKAFLLLVQKHEVEEIQVSKLCQLAQVNRSTFYANYIDIYDLSQKVKQRMIEEYASIFENDETASSDNKDSFLKMFRHIKENQIFYKTYFKLKYDVTNDEIIHYDRELAKKYYDDQYIDYHVLMFKAGITILIKEWLKHDCQESPETMVKILLSEYNKGSSKEK